MKNENQEKNVLHVITKINGKTTKKKGFLSKLRKPKIHDMTAKKENNKIKDII